jgi:transposase InsO family protein
MIDCFARYVKLYPVKSTEAVHAVKALLQWIGTFGCPSQLLSDNGSQYVNNLIAEFTKIVGTEHVTTMAYSKEENAIVERVNKEVLRHLRAILFEKGLKDKWSLIYPLVERIINSEIHSVIKVSPAQIVFGNAIDLDRGIFLPHFVNDKQMKFSEYTARLLQAQADVIKVAYESQTKSDLHHIAMHTPQLTEFPINSYVLAQYENSEHRPPSKFHLQHKGPFLVVNHLGSIYTVRNLVTNKLEDYHITNLRPFLYDPEMTDPREVANADQGVMDVIEVTDHKYNTKYPNRYSLYTFKVHWADGTESWEPWSAVRRNEVLHDYLKLNGLQRFIPREFFD